MDNLDHSQKEFKCDLCNFSCRFKHVLNRHKGRDHFDEIAFKFKCTSCRFGFASRSSYTQHVNVIHKDDGTRLKCTVIFITNNKNEIYEYQCGKLFQLLGTAKRHLELVHKIRTKDAEEAKKYFKSEMTRANQFRRSKQRPYGYGGNNVSKHNNNSDNSQNKNIDIKEKVAVQVQVDDPDEILKILENNETDDLDSNSNLSYPLENICIIEEKFIPDVTTSDLPTDDMISCKNEINEYPDQIKESVCENKPFALNREQEKKLFGNNEVTDKRVNNLTNKPQVPTNPQRASLSRSCKNPISAEILQSSTQQVDSDSDETNFDSDSESEIESESKLKVKAQEILCNLCQKVFSRKYRLREHLISSKHPENRTQCTKCPEHHYVVKGTLKKHHEDVIYGRKRKKNIPKSKPKDEDYPCTKCHKVFDFSWKLRNHRRYCQITNITEKNFHCKECNLFFKTSYYLSEHLKFTSRHVPTKGKRFFCEQCPSGFTRSTDLKKHVQTKHENDGTRYECHICCCSYGRSDTLVAHMKKEEHKLREKDFLKKNQVKTIKTEV